MKRLLSLLFMPLLTLTTGMTHAAETYELSVAHPTSTIHPVHVYLSTLLKGIEEKSGGRLEFHIYDNSTLIKSDSMYKALKSGGADIGMLPIAFASSDMPYSLTHDMSFLTSDALKAGELLWAMREMPEIQAEIAKSNTCLLFGTSGDRPGLGSINTPIRAMSDLQGKRILYWQPYLIDEIKAWGGIPVQIPIPDTYVALQRGMGEVLYGAVPMFAALKLHEIVKSVTIMPSNMGGNWWLINKESLGALPEDLQKLLLEETGHTASVGLSQAVRDATDRDLQLIAEHGVEIITLSDEEMQPWKDASIKAMASYWQELLKRGGEKEPDVWMSKVRALAEKIEADR